MFKFEKKRPEMVGVDIGASAIKISAVLREPDRNVLTAYNIKELAPGASTDEIKRTLSGAFREIDLSPKNVNFSVSGPDVLVRFIELPRMNKDTLMGSLVYEAEKYIPFDVKDVIFDAHILGEADRGNMKVLLAAAKKGIIESRLDIASAIGVVPKNIDISSIAMFNAYKASANAIDENESTVFLDIGSSQTGIVIVSGGQPCFIRQIQIGGANFSPVFNCQGTAGSPGADTKDVAGENVLNAAEAAFQDLVSEMHLSCGYFENRCGMSVNRILCSGGACFNEGLMSCLKKKFSCKVGGWDPFSGISIDENLSSEDVTMVGPRLAVSLGLALRD